MEQFVKGEFDVQDKLNKNFGEIESTLSGMSQQSHTYAELAAMVANKTLVPGTQYVLTDYKTKYIQPDTNTLKEMTVERLVLTATSQNAFSQICSSLDFPQDIVYYKFDLNLCEDGTTPRNGFITRRIDESPNVLIDCPLDWRTMLWARWKPDPNNYLIGTTVTPYSIWTSGAATMNVIYKVGNALYMAITPNVTPTSNTDSNVFHKIYDDINIGFLPNGNLKVGSTGSADILLMKGDLHERPTFGTGCNRINIRHAPNGVYNGYEVLHNNVIGDNSCVIDMAENSYRNTIGNSCSSIKLGANSHDNCILVSGSNSIFLGVNCYNNVFAGLCAHNTYMNNCYSNIMWGICGGNQFNSDCCGNVLGGGCNTNFLAGYGAYNYFKSCCTANTCGVYFHNNNIGIGCNSNFFGSDCYSNTIGDGCIENTFGSSVDMNTFGKGCNYNSIDDCKSNNFGDNCCNITSKGGNNGNIYGSNVWNVDVKYMRNKNISNIAAIQARDYTTTIEKRNDGNVVYWSYNSSGAPVAAIIA
jgi:hypothetical protein